MQSKIVRFWMSPFCGLYRIFLNHIGKGDLPLFKRREKQPKNVQYRDNGDRKTLLHISVDASSTKTHCENENFLPNHFRLALAWRSVVSIVAKWI